MTTPGTNLPGSRINAAADDLQQHSPSTIPPVVVTTPGTNLRGSSVSAAADTAVQGSMASALHSVTGTPLHTVGISQTKSRPPSVS